MTTTWILVANASQARIFTSPKAKLYNGNSSLQLVGEYDHPKSRMKNLEMSSDKSGHYQGKGEGHGDFVEATSPKEYEAMQFAKQLAQVLEAGSIADHYQELILVAPPEFHGLVSNEFTPQPNNMAITHINKDYTSDNEKQLIDHLESFI